MPSNYIIAPYYTYVNRNDSAKKILFEESKKKMIFFAKIIKEQKNVFEIKNNSIRLITKLFNISNNLSNRKIWDKIFILMLIAIPAGFAKRFALLVILKL